MGKYWLVPGEQLARTLSILCLVCFACAKLDKRNIQNESRSVEIDIEISSLLVEKLPYPNPTVPWEDIHWMSSNLKPPIKSNESSEPAEPGQIVDGILDISASEAEIHVLVLSCNGSHPIQWRFYPAKEALLHTFSALEMALERELTSRYGANRTSYMAHLSINSLSNEMTGKYVCETVNHDMDMYKGDEVYVFWEEVLKPTLVNAGEIINLDTILGWIDLPCGTSNRTTHTFLYTQPLEAFYMGTWDITKSFTEIPPNASILEDQFSGFKLNIEELNRAFQFVWICTPSKFFQGTVGQLEEAVRVLLSKPPPSK